MARGATRAPRTVRWSRTHERPAGRWGSRPSTAVLSPSSPGGWRGRDSNPRPSGHEMTYAGSSEVGSRRFAELSSVRCGLVAQLGPSACAAARPTDGVRDRQQVVRRGDALKAGVSPLSAIDAGASRGGDSNPRLRSEPGGQGTRAARSRPPHVEPTSPVPGRPSATTESATERHAARKWSGSP
jgi:hypothetical protein